MQVIDVTTTVAGLLRMIVTLIDRVLVVVVADDVEDFAASLAIPIVLVVRLGAVPRLVDFRPARSFAGPRIAVFVQLLVGEAQLVNEIVDLRAGQGVERVLVVASG